MINLIPNEEKKAMKTDFYLRLVVMFFVVMGISIFVAIIPLVPTYIFSVSQKKLALQRLEIQEMVTLEDISNEKSFLIENINSKLKKINEIRKEKVFVSKEIINPIILGKDSSVRITTISYVSNINGDDVVSVRGIASSREKLVVYKNYLENLPNFTDVDLPISNLIRGNDIQFDIKLKPKL